MVVVATVGGEFIEHECAAFGGLGGCLRCLVEKIVNEMELEQRRLLAQRSR